MTNKWITFVRALKPICLDNTTENEIRQLEHEIMDSDRKYYPDFSADYILKHSVYVKGAKVDDCLVGIGGITYTHGIYSTFHMIKKEYQGKGIGKMLCLNNLNYCRMHDIPLLVFIIFEGNIAAIKNGITSGDIELFRYKGKRYSYVVFNNRGKWISYILPVALRIFAFIKN